MERNQTISTFLAKTMFNGAIFISSNLVLICAEILLSCKCLENQYLPENQLKIRQKWLGKVQVLEPTYQKLRLTNTGCVKSTGTTFGGRTELHGDLTKILLNAKRKILNKSSYDYEIYFLRNHI